jgi:hypothetical protein
VLKNGKEAREEQKKKKKKTSPRRAAQTNRDSELEP